METKFCRDCGEHRPVSAFSRNSRSRDGLAFYCREHLAERSLLSREARRTTPRKNRRVPDEVVVPEGHKWCHDCARTLPLDQFAKSRAATSGIATYCLPCHNARGKRSRDALGGSRSYHLTRRYGITAAEADVILASQGGPAAHVDHDHATDAVRDLLCFQCNGGLGQFRDDPAVLRLAADYVERHRGEPAAAPDPPTGCATTPALGSDRRERRGSRPGRRSTDRHDQGEQSDRRRTAGEADA